MTSSAGQDAGATTSWTQQRAEVIRAQERALASARRIEHEKATALIREAIIRFEEAGIPPIPLRAKPFKGGGTIRTALTGWYLKTDRTVAVDTEARYYVMRVDGGLRSRLLGATPDPVDAPLVVGRGARDGESFDLPDLLRMRLDDPVRG
ncbi:hypothetical protein [Brachybacterium hainanense]|uniref:Uncharacterized protein n=1 Tax=Brachybacterium hainanense TaxID=1541174 RepID=A0ABV6RAC0_9MICO